MKNTRHQRLHLDTYSGRLLGWNPSTKAEETFDLRAESIAEKGNAKPGAVLQRHLADNGRITTDCFGSVGFADRFKPPEKEMLEQRAKEINGADTVDFSRVIRARWSLATPNRSNIVVPNDAWDLEKFNGSNPIGAWSHRTIFSGPESIIARWLITGHKTSSEKSDLIGFEEFAPADVNPMASTVLGLYKFGALNAFSPGFLVGFVDFEGADDSIIFGSKEEPNELVELSNVPVGRHADAVLMALSDGAVEVGPLREFIGLQLEVAYSDPMQLMETARLEAVAKKLGLIGATALVDLGADEIEALELPAGEGDDLAAQRVNALRTRQVGAVSVEEDAWTRFLLGTKTKDNRQLSDEVILFAARAAGLEDEAAALEAVMVENAEEPPAGDESEPAVTAEEFEAAQAIVTRHAAENPPAADDPPAGEEEQAVDDTNPPALTVEALQAAVVAGIQPIVTKSKNRSGKLHIPA